MTEISSSRDAIVARNVAWAEKQGLHPRAIMFAKQYANLTRGSLTLISAYEKASDSKDPIALRTAWENVIRYIRTLKPAFEESGSKAA